jgi:hypothetical protein
MQLELCTGLILFSLFDIIHLFYPLLLLLGVPQRGLLLHQCNTLASLHTCLGYFAGSIVGKALRCLRDHALVQIGEAGLDLWGTCVGAAVDRGSVTVSLGLGVPLLTHVLFSTNSRR